MVQHRYARYTSRDYGRTSSVTAILKTLGLEPLAERRAKARIIMMYILVHGIVDILASDHIPNEVTEAESIDTFKERLSHFASDVEITPPAPC